MLHPSSGPHRHRTCGWWGGGTPLKLPDVDPSAHHAIASPRPRLAHQLETPCSFARCAIGTPIIVLGLPLLPPALLRGAGLMVNHAALCNLPSSALTWLWYACLTPHSPRPLHLYLCPCTSLSVLHTYTAKPSPTWLGPGRTMNLPLLERRPAPVIRNLSLSTAYACTIGPMQLSSLRPGLPTSRLVLASVSSDMTVSTSPTAASAQQVSRRPPCSLEPGEIFFIQPCIAESEQIHARSFLVHSLYE